ncbi:hypothetical protein [Hamadaea tsunoensis]|uniref:hypothetical protein n=1 Tax=Hamadaea tsunoensis TaxID=53368 RepID=UPI00041EE4A0|nr:hypothetical protein [Hamadaea tsunoensis]
MSEAILVGDELIDHCARCGARTVGLVDEALVGDRIVWSVSLRCDGCDNVIEADYSGRIYPIERAALIARAGLVRLCVAPEAAQGLRLPLLTLFRRQGMTYAEAAAAHAALIGEGVVGTPAEMQLLANRLAVLGVAGTRTVRAAVNPNTAAAGPRTAPRSCLDHGCHPNHGPRFG